MCLAAGGLSCSDHPTYYADIKPILDARCVSCHIDGGAGPFPLDHYDAAYAYRAVVADAVVDRRMPPWHADSGKRAYKADPSLSAGQIDLVATWAETGGKRGDPAHAGAPLPGISRGDVDSDLVLKINTPYTPELGGDDYRCFLLDWPLAQTAYVTGYRLVPGAADAVHHAISFLAYPETVSGLEALDRDDPGPGWACYGGPGGDWLDFLDIGGLGAWVPGIEANPFPAGTGVRVPPGSRPVLQVHYNTLTANPVSDQTEMFVALTDAVEREATYFAFTNPQWIFTNGMKIPPGEVATYSYRYDLTSVMASNLSVASLTTTIEPLRIYSVLMHAHTLGRRLSLSIEKADGQTVWLVDIPDWDFNWQREYHLAQVEVFEPGDTLVLTCEFDNTAANQPIVDGRQQTPRMVYWGDGSLDEMCLAGFYVSLDR